MKKSVSFSILGLALLLSSCFQTPPAPATPTPTDEPGIITSKATCTATSEERPDYALPGDWISGATEGYATTIIEYGDFQ
ncbi:MAG: hypothetical protein OEY93_08125 [Anaerolineae bacterium]|nr:hypothetical protein [Anaerolineae bacterium]